MPPRQSSSRRWLLVTDGSRRDLPTLARQLPRGSGIVLLVPLSAREMRRLRQIAVARDLRVTVEGPGAAARVHNMRELRGAMTARTPLIMLSPMFETASHPGWRPLPRMRAATLARIGGRRLIALGGMNDKRYRLVAGLGFGGWAGISAFRT